MAFQNKKLSVIAYANGFTLWHYKENATLATITASGYFSSLKNLMNTGDIILINVVTLMNSGDIILINASDKTAMRAISVADNVVSVAALD